MIQFSKVVVSTENAKIKDIICDCCKQSCRVFIDAEHTVSNFEYMFLKAQWGYATKNEDSIWEAQICENCVEKHLKPIISFKVTEYDPLFPMKIPAIPPLELPEKPFTA